MKIERLDILGRQAQLKAFSTMLFLGATLGMGLGCRQDKNKTAATPAIVTPQLSESQTKSIPAPPMFKIMNNDSEFDSLLRDYRKLEALAKSEDEDSLKAFVQTYSGDYKTQQERREKERQAKIQEIEDKTKHLSDQFRKLAQEKDLKTLETTFPDLKAKTFLVDAKAEFFKRVDSFMERYRDAYFQFATYEFCMPEHKICFFSLKKSPVFTEYSKELRSFSMPYTPNLFRFVGKSRDLGEATINNEDVYGLMGYYSTMYYNKDQKNKIIDHRGSYGYKNFERDWLNLPKQLNVEKAFSPNNECKLAMAVEIPFEVMSEVVSASDNVWSKKIQDLVDKQMTIGEESMIGPVTGARLVTKYKYDEVKEYMTAFLRRNSIFLIARGNPFKKEISETYLIVSGVDKYFVKFKLDGKK